MLMNDRPVPGASNSPQSEGIKSAASMSGMRLSPPLSDANSTADSHGTNSDSQEESKMKPAMMSASAISADDLDETRADYERPLAILSQNLVCLLKTKTGAFKRHNIEYTNDQTIQLVRGKDGRDSKPAVKQSLRSCHIRKGRVIKVNAGGSLLYPIQVDQMPDRTRLFYFETEADQETCLEVLLEVQGIKSSLEQYLMVKELGDGISSKVMLGEHRFTHEKFAIKVVQESYLSDERLCKMLDREIEILKQCKNCPNIIRYKEDFTCDGNRYIVMELADSGDLHQLLQKNQFEPLTESRARPIFQQVAQSLKFLHERQIIHRDIKMENILLSLKSENEFEAKLADFGLVETVTQADKLGKNSGTPGYTAPEILEGLEYGVASDVWSLGCLLFGMLTAELPIDAARKRSMRLGSALPLNIAPESQPDLLELINLSDPTKDLLRRTLERDVTKRLTIEQVLDHEFFCRSKK